jgi:hypothetical protein
MLFKNYHVTLKEISHHISNFENHLRIFDTVGFKPYDVEETDHVIDSLRFIDKALCEGFVRDWCLKTFRYLEISSKLDLGQLTEDGDQIRNGLRAKAILEGVTLSVHEYLCLMANAIDKQKILLEIHNPDFRLKKEVIVTQNTGGKDYHSAIYRMDADKPCFTGERTLGVFKRYMREYFRDMGMATDLTHPKYAGKVDTFITYADFHDIKEFYSENF